MASVMESDGMCWTIKFTGPEAGTWVMWYMYTECSPHERICHLLSFSLICSHLIPFFVYFSAVYLFNVLTGPKFGGSCIH